MIVHGCASHHKRPLDDRRKAAVNAEAMTAAALITSIE
jgi:hypothetical protein